jgi:hypothetical protein
LAVDSAQLRPAVYGRGHAVVLRPKLRDRVRGDLARVDQPVAAVLNQSNAGTCRVPVRHTGSWCDGCVVRVCDCLEEERPGVGPGLRERRQDRRRFEIVPPAAVHS